MLIDGLGGGMWFFLAVGAVSLFFMIAATSWSAERRKEREAYYRFEMLKKLADQSTANAPIVLEVLREQERARERRQRQGQLLGGPVTMAAGIGLMLFFRAVASEPVWLLGSIPFLVGLVLLVYGLASGRRPSA